MHPKNSKRLDDVTLAFVVFVLCCLASFLLNNGWLAEAFVSTP
jgi:type III secretory pathway component EscS